MALILDGTSPTGAWSMYRDLLTSFVGGTRYTTATGVNQLTDQTGNARHLVRGSAGAQPAVTTAGPNSRTCADFDGSSKYLDSGTNHLATVISQSSGYFVVSFMADAVTLNNATPNLNNPIFGHDYVGLFLKNTGTPASMLGWNYAGASHVAEKTSTITVGTPYVAEWRHEGGNLYVRINGGTEVSVASGSTTAVTNFWYVGINGGSAYADFKLFELATFSTVPALATRNAIVADFMAQHVAATGSSVKVWTGSAWACKPLKVWNGSAWVGKTVKAWSGSAWVEKTCVTISAATWDAATVTAVTLSGGNLAATNTGTTSADQGARVATVSGKTTGKYYFELTQTVIPSGGGNRGVGIGTTASTYTGIGNGGGVTGAIVYFFSGNIYANGSNSGKSLTSVGATSVVGVAVDLDNRKIWFKKVSGTPTDWNGDISANPATNVGGVTVPAGTMVPFTTFGGTSGTAGNAHTANFGASTFTGTVPSGFTSGWPV